MNASGCVTLVDYQLWLQAYRDFIAHEGLADRISRALAQLDRYSDASHLGLSC